ncbi:MAG: flagellar hook-length control protein FliK [Candidatus Hydrogenedentes bacterium]|nr:flagellar hook-length control protein FliK [Candidatus Hydrogenedentota bacterium]
MNVSTDMRRDEALEAVKRPGAYAYAPGAGGFFELLTRLNTGPDLRAPGQAPDAPRDDSAPSPEARTPAPSHDAGRTGAAQDSDAASEAATSTADTNETPDSAETPDALRDPTDSENAESGEALTNVNTPLPEGAETAPADTTAEAAAPARATDAPVTQPALESPDTVSTAPLLQAEAPSNTSAPPGHAAATSAEKSPGPALAADVEIEADPAPDDAPPPLPKTLNALLAESVLREMAPRDAAPLSLEAESALDMPRESGATAPAEEAPLPAPTPRAGAMDIAGVRTDTATPPRIPLANLPGELVQQVHLMQQEGARSMRLRIVPEHLGELRIEIHGAGDTLRVRMIAASATVRDALDSQMADLRQAFQKQGLNLNNVTVDAGAGGRESPYRQESAPRYAPGSQEEPPAPEARPRAETRDAGPAPGATALNILA